jgi:transcriptional regulator with XRE-family HTH domain
LSTIAMLRARAGVSLRELSARCATSHTTICAIELGTNRISVKAQTIERICNGLGATASETLDALFEARKLPAETEATIFRDRAAFERAIEAAR